MENLALLANLIGREVVEIRLRDGTRFGYSSAELSIASHELLLVRCEEIDEPFETNCLKFSELAPATENAGPLAASRKMSLAVGSIKILERDQWIVDPVYDGRSPAGRNPYRVYERAEGPLGSAPSDSVSISTVCGLILANMKAEDKLLIYTTEYQNLLNITQVESEILSFVNGFSITKIDKPPSSIRSR